VIRPKLQPALGVGLVIKIYYQRSPELCGRDPLNQILSQV